MRSIPRSRLATALLWCFAGTMHFVVPRAYESIVPRSIARWKREAVIVSGAAEIAGGVAVLPGATRRAARWWLLGVLAAVYPANIQMALHPERHPGLRPALLWARLPLQFVFAAGTWRGTR